jgi:hypothetical protein
VVGSRRSSTHSSNIRHPSIDSQLHRLQIFSTRRPEPARERILG